MNLNSDKLVLGENCEPEHALRNPSTVQGKVEVCFADIESRILRIIEDPRTTGMVGVVAWMTNRRLLKALAGVSASFIVQKEDFLRPCSGEPAWNRETRSLYEQVGGDICRYWAPAPLCGMSVAGDPFVSGIRCAGVRGDRRSGFPRVHHKFAVALESPDGSGLTPYAVITGSFNWTENANRSRENIVVVSDKMIAAAYVFEWSQVCAISEPLNWEDEYVAPEWRFGT